MGGSPSEHFQTDSDYPIRLPLASLTRVNFSEGFAELRLQPHTRSNELPNG